MKMIKNKKTLEVTLSRRNLLALLLKLDGYPKDSACTIYTDIDTDGYILVVKAEEDDKHYADRPAPGTMHPDTEKVLPS